LHWHAAVSQYLPAKLQVVQLDDPEQDLVPVPQAVQLVVDPDEMVSAPHLLQAEPVQ
jgi:hypothetical protein